MIRQGDHLTVDGGLLLPAWACWVMEQHLSIDQLRELAYVDDLELFEILTDLRTAAFQGRADLIAQAESKPVTNVAESRNSSDDSEMLDADQVAAHLEMKAPAVRKAARDGRLNGYKSGKRGDWVFTMAAVEAFAASRVALMPTATLTDKVSDLTIAYRRRLEGIVANTKLTDEGKRRSAVKAWAETVDEISELRQANDKALETEKRKIQDRYFGPPKLSVVADASTNIANIGMYRDALDRAERAEGLALAALINRAHRIGDESQVRAGLAVAFDGNDVNAINTHLEHRPQDEPELQHLVDLSAAGSLAGVALAEFNLAAPEPPFGLTPSDARRLLESEDG